MKFRKLLSLIAVSAVIISMSACGEKEPEGGYVDVADYPTQEETTFFPEKTEENITESDPLKALIPEDISTTASDSTRSDDPSLWSKAEIIEFYKAAAKKSDKNIKTQQLITLKDVSINNGQYEGVIDFVMPIMSKLLENNSTEKEGITGGYNNLIETDVKSAKAYKVGKNTAIEMVMVNQTDGAKADLNSGTVGHAISVVGDITVVTDQLNDLGLPIKISEKDTKIYYTNPAVRVIIDENGNIVCGTWGYTVEISLNNYIVAKSPVDSTSVIMDNIITFNGGFKK